jgi:hypothetical protein
VDPVIGCGTSDAGAVGATRRCADGGVITVDAEPRASSPGYRPFGIPGTVEEGPA